MLKGMWKWLQLFLGWVWKNRRQLSTAALDAAEELGAPPSSPLPHSEVDHIERQIAAGARPFPKDPPLPNLQPPRPKTPTPSDRQR